MVVNISIVSRINISSKLENLLPQSATILIQTVVGNLAEETLPNNNKQT
jgi:hypothetical protein